MPHTPSNSKEFQTFSTFWDRVTLVVSGPSGVGKSTLLKGLLEKYPHIEFSISHTTRKVRAGEETGVDYHFISEQQFLHLQKNDTFLEYAKVYGQYYGTSRHELQRIRENAKTPLIEVDVQGAISIRMSIPDTLLIMILPPDETTLQNRLVARSTEDVETIKRRLERTKEEMPYVFGYDYFVVNNDANTALDHLISILIAESQNVKYLRPDFLTKLVSNV